MASKNKGSGEGRAPTPNETAWQITGRLIAGMALYGGLGWLLSRWFGHEALFVAGGLLLGITLSLLLIHYTLANETKELKQKL